MSSTANDSSIGALLEREVAYSGQGISVKSLEDTISSERKLQNTQVSALETLRARNVEIQGALEEEVARLRKLSDYVSRGEVAGSMWSRFKELLSFIPGLKNLAITQRSIEELLRQQYEISVKRVKEASEFADELQLAEQSLYDEIERLNGRIIEAARNEETAAEYVLELEAARADLQARRDAVSEETAETREIQRELDRVKRVLAEHSTQLQLYHTAETRLNRLKAATDLLAETIANLRSDITQYVMAAGEKLDMVAGQINAIGTAADASVVMLEMKRSLDAMTESLNQTTQFVSETQVFFRQNLDSLIADLEVFDTETETTLRENLELSRAVEDERIKRAVAVALESKNEQAATADSP